MTNYNVVPNIIASKDLDYLSDMFNWNYDAFKCTYNSLDKITDEEIRSMMNRVSDVFRNNMNSVLSILGGNHE
ncbi:MAG: hypothetical protein IJZ46_02925 [Bacilli bacterium]|nr:hypothetical protein [Bacilli bacterium]